MKEHEEIIRDVSLLARLPEAELRSIASRGRIHSYPAGTVIFHEGDPGDSLYVVIEGSVRIVVLSSEGGEATVALLGPGECVGDLALLDGRPRSASAVTAQPTKAMVVTRDDFRQWLSRQPKAAFALLETLSLRVRRTDEALTDLAFLDLPHRLAKRLVDLAIAQYGHDGHANLTPGVKLQITQAELGSMLGVSRESVNKQLNAFAREGWIRLRRGSVTLVEPEALRTFA